MAATRRYLLPPISKITRPPGRISALRNIILTSVGFDHSAALTSLTQALKGCSASPWPGPLQKFFKVPTARFRPSVADHISPIPRLLQHRRDLLENGGIIDGGGHAEGLAIGDRPHRRPEDLAGPRLGQPLHHHRRLEACHRTDALA